MFMCAVSAFAKLLKCLDYAKLKSQRHVFLSYFSDGA